MSDERVIVRIVREIADKHGWKVQTYSDDWVIEISNNVTRTYIYGYVLPNNNASVNYLAKDKSAMYDVLDHHNIPAVEHKYYLGDISAREGRFVCDMPAILGYLARYGTIVIKDNVGTGGRGVYKASSKAEVEEILDQYATDFESISVSPYLDIDAEYRVIVEDGKCRLAYEKERAFVTGDGKSTIAELATAKYGKTVTIDRDIARDMIVPQGDNVLLNWRHNLGLGAVPSNVDDVTLLHTLYTLASMVVDVVGIQLASVDIVEVNGKYMILEINGGLMMEKWATASPNNYKTACEIYEHSLLNAMKSKY